jgi:hypothetical protein
VKNTTVSVPDEVYRVARIRAAERGSSLRGLVAEYLRSLSDSEQESARLEAQQERVLDEISRFDGVVLSEDLSEGVDYEGIRVVNPFR